MRAMIRIGFSFPEGVYPQNSAAAAPPGMMITAPARDHDAAAAKGQPVAPVRALFP